MPILLNRNEVLHEYELAAERRWVLPCFGTENLTTTEAILAGALERGREIGIPDLPVTVAITHRYSERSQSAAYSHTGDPVLGLRLFHADLHALVSPDSPFKRLRVMAHLDHGQHKLDEDVLEAASGVFSSVMFDASSLSFEENMVATREYVRRHGQDLVIEGACDSISQVGESNATPCTSAEDAERYYHETGVDWVVANLGTEHRAGVSELRYRADVARKIGRRIGSRLCLHGASSVAPSALATLFEDGIVKVNLWTALERDSSADLLKAMLLNAGAVTGAKIASQLHSDGLLGPSCEVESPVSLEFCTTKYRQDVVFQSMRSAVLSHLRRWFPK